MRALDMNGRSFRAELNLQTRCKSQYKEELTLAPRFQVKPLMTAITTISLLFVIFLCPQSHLAVVLCSSNGKGVIHISSIVGGRFAILIEIIFSGAHKNIGEQRTKRRSYCDAIYLRIEISIERKELVS